MKKKLIERLIEGGVNKNEARKIVNKRFEYVERVYPTATVNKKAEVIMSIQ